MKIFCVYTLTFNYKKEKLIKQSHLQLYQKKNNLGISITKEVKDLYLETIRL